MNKPFNLEKAMRNGGRCVTETSQEADIVRTGVITLTEHNYKVTVAEIPEFRRSGMAQSDVIALNSNFDQWLKTSGAGLTGIKPFNYYTIENILKDFPVNYKEIMAGAVDQTSDGGKRAGWCGNNP